MLRTLVLIGIGVVIGYSFGFKDAQRHGKTVVERLVDSAGASARGKYDADLDKKAATLDR